MRACEGMHRVNLMMTIDVQRNFAIRPYYARVFGDVWHCFIHWVHSLSLTASEIYPYLCICTHLQQSVVVFPFWPCSVAVPSINSSRTLPGGMSLCKQTYNHILSLIWENNWDFAGIYHRSPLFSHWNWMCVNRTWIMAFFLYFL